MPFPSLKLTYIDFTGHAEITRLALFLDDIPFKDERLSPGAFLVRKPHFPFQQVPTLTVNGEESGQSHTWARYVGHLTDLYPTADPLGALCIDEMLSAFDDITATLVPWFIEFDPHMKLAICKQLTDVTLPSLFASVEARLMAAPATSPFILAHAVGYMTGLPATIADTYPRWNAIADEVATFPKVQEGYATHA